MSNQFASDKVHLRKTFLSHTYELVRETKRERQSTTVFQTRKKTLFKGDVKEKHIFEIDKYFLIMSKRSSLFFAPSTS